MPSSASSKTRDSRFQRKPPLKGNMTRFCTMRHSATSRKTASTVCMGRFAMVRHESRNSTVIRAQARRRVVVLASRLPAVISQRHATRRTPRTAASARAVRLERASPSRAPLWLAPPAGCSSVPAVSRLLRNRRDALLMRGQTSTTSDPSTPPMHWEPVEESRSRLKSPRAPTEGSETMRMLPLLWTKNHTMTRQTSWMSQ